MIQNAALRALDLDGSYTALQCGPDRLETHMRALASAGGGGNVTLPHKERAARMLDVATPVVRRTGACNTFWGVDGELHGDNTDVGGFARARADLMKAPAHGARVLVLGAGGAARAVLVSLLDEGVERVFLANRTLSRAETLAERLDDARITVVRSVQQTPWDSLDLVVNATSLGLHARDPLPLALERIARPTALLDLVYHTSLSTRLVREARVRGLAACDGTEMLIQQGALAFTRWWEVPAPVEAMRTAFHGALRHP
jgi:shikimate dehydrogenase